MNSGMVALLRGRWALTCWFAIAMTVIPLAGPPMTASTSLAFSRGDQPAPSPHQVLRNRKPRRKAAPSPAMAALVLVRDIRMKTYPDHTRLVLDLQRSISFTQNRLKSPDRVIIELQNTQLGKIAKERLVEVKLPDEVTITQPHSRSVAISLNLQSISDYKLLPLRQPDRLVVDVFGHGNHHPVLLAQPVIPAPSLQETLAPPTPPPPPQPKAPAPIPAPVIRADQRAPRDDIKLVVIDPGHGGKDPGAIGRSGMAEKDITLYVGLRLRDLIVQRLKKNVLMTRDRDAFIELEDRAKFANTMGADLFISVHVNSHPQRSTKGVEIYHFGEASDRRALEVAARENGTPIKDTGVGWQYLVADLLTTKKVQESLELAWTTKKSMIARLDDYYDVEDHGVKTAPFYVLRFTSMPSILAEIAFITNPTEERLMQSDAFLYRMAEAILDGIKTYAKPLQAVSR